MAQTKTAPKTETKRDERIIAETDRPAPAPEPMTDAALAAIPGAEVIPDLADDLATLDPKAVKTMTEDVLGKPIIITRVALHESQLADDKAAQVDTDEATAASGKPREYASIEFYVVGDDTFRFLTTGAGRLVPVIRNMLDRKYKLPVRATIVQDRTSKGVRYFHFAGKDGGK